MGTPYIGEIRMVGFNFAPAGWAFCDGQLLPISEHDALFALIGTTYGGDGQTTFALPDLRGRLPMHQSAVDLLAMQGGVETVTLTVNQIPAHSHALHATTAAADLFSPTGATMAVTASNLYAAPGTLTPMASGAVGGTGGSQPHDNRMPYLCVNFIISLFGIFPQPN